MHNFCHVNLYQATLPVLAEKLSNEAGFRAEPSCCGRSKPNSPSLILSPDTIQNVRMNSRLTGKEVESEAILEFLVVLSIQVEFMRIEIHHK